MEQVPTYNNNFEFKKTNVLPVLDWGGIDYELSNSKQQSLVAEVYENNKPGYLIYCTHSPLVTTGRATKKSDVHSWQGEVLKTPRGGRATYHGPSQLVIYPIVNLNYLNFNNFKTRDITSYLRLLEKVTIQTLNELKIEAYQRCEKVDYNGEKLEATGVWVGDKKIASIGVAVRKWVSYHGIAINVHDDDNAFQGINPCGFSSNIMTTIESEIGKKLTLDSIKSIFNKKFNDVFN